MDNKQSRYVMLVLLIILSMIGIGAIYMQKDASGHIIYSDTSLPNSTAVVLPETNNQSNTTSTTNKTTIQTENTTVTVEEGKGEVPSTQPASNAQSAHEENVTPPTNLIPPPVVRESYAQFYIESPKEQETIQNQVTIPVVIGMKPDLFKGDTIQLYVDNKPWGDPSPSINLALSGVERGTHSISAAIVDSHGVVVKQTPGVTIYVHRASAATRPKPPAPPKPTSLLQRPSAFMAFLKELIVG